MESEGQNLTQLGSGTNYKYAGPCVEMLETFENKNLGIDYEIQLIFPEWTSKCPKTGQPDFATITIDYIPNKVCIESKSLKLYFFAYRDEGAFMETLTNKILNDLVKACSPKWMRVYAELTPGGVCRLM